jgi:hypothetical protein
MVMGMLGMAMVMGMLGMAVVMVMMMMVMMTMEVYGGGICNDGGSDNASGCNDGDIFVR